MELAAKLRNELRELRAHFQVVPSTRRLLIALIVADMAWIALHIARTITAKYEIAPFDAILGSQNLAIDAEGGWPELWQQLKALATAVLLVLAALRVRDTAAYGAWAALFAFAALDDGLALHERSGAFMADALGLSPLGALQGHDLGELLFAVAAGTLLLAAIVCASSRSARHHAVRGWMFLLPLGGLALCGIGLDLLHGLIRYRFAGSNLILTVLEDGGEMLFMSLACALAFAVFARATEMPDDRSAPYAPVGRS